MQITKKMLGCHKGIVNKLDYLVSTFLGDGTLPSSFDITSKMTPVKSQGQEGSCVGYAMAVGVKEYQEQKDYDKYIELSPRYVYEGAKKISGHSEGTTLVAAMQVVHQHGICEERFWPYVANQPGEPLKGAEKNALKYKVLTYARVRNIDELKRAITTPTIGATMIGVKVYNGMVSGDCKKTGIVPDPSCWDRMKVLGGHAITVVAYDDKSPFYSGDGHVKFKNSWGKTWGENGYGYLSYKYIAANMLDSFSCIDIDDPEAYSIQRLGHQIEWEGK